ncbi:MAG: hypothetical protein EHM42_10760 [Planctomycetaceae bacterium]|nr:MAG: hypothetical protein EHM42_15005 [Planctomycetaceae bacterium]RPI81351.1 MAG: hypothetical protein EHM42_10760 [Planctomycetaceae bacterium]
MPVSQPTGINHKLYRNTGSFAVAVWNEVPNTRDITQSDSFAEADVSRRAAGLRQTEPTLRDISIDFEMIWDTADADFAAMYGFYAAKTMTEFAIADGGIGTAGTVASGGTADVVFLRFEAKITKWEKSLPLEGPATVAVTIKPCYSANASTYNTVA